MISKKDINSVATEIAIATKAKRVILFGSYARGEATEQSDVDYMVVADSSLPRFKRSRELYKLFSPHPFSMDIIVYTPQEFETGIKSSLSFVSTVVDEGQVLYER